MTLDPRAFLRSLFNAAVAAAAPGPLLAGHLPSPPTGRVVVVGAGKAAASMARAVEDHWPGPPSQLSGLVVTRYGYDAPCARIEVVEAGHPIPDEHGMAAAQRILDLARRLGRDDLLVSLVSGGGSSLLALPAAGITLQHKQEVSRALLACGARIKEINCVRTHLSAIKGGHLAAAAHPARVFTYLISDVPGDDPAIVASGPTVPDQTTYADALAVLGGYGVDVPLAVKDHLLAGARAAPRLAFPAQETSPPSAALVPEETPKPGDPSFADDTIVTLASARTALAAAAGAARTAGVTPLVLGDAIEGKARDVGAAHARLALALARGDHAGALAELHAGAVAFSTHASELDARAQPLPSPPCVILSGGETTVTVAGGGRGGRNAEYVLSLVTALGEHQNIWTLAADTDGIDGTEDNAGAGAGPDTLARARIAHLDPVEVLARHDSYTFFATLGDLVTTGPTRTNVNDFRAILLL